MKCILHARGRCGGRSHPARGAWIEMRGAICWALTLFVAPRKGCVD